MEGIELKNNELDDQIDVYETIAMAIEDGNGIEPDDIDQIKAAANCPHLTKEEMVDEIRRDTTLGRTFALLAGAVLERPDIDEVLESNVA